MINTSKAIYKQPFTLSVTLQFASGGALLLDESEIALSDSNIQANTGTSAYPLGCVVGRTVQLSLINNNGRYNNYDFLGAVATITYDYGDNCKVIYRSLTVTEPPESLGQIITMTCVDNSWRLDKTYTPTITFPASMSALYRDVCSCCGLSYYNTLPTTAGNVSVQQAPDKTATCRELMSYMAAAAIGNIYINANGQLQFVPLLNPNSAVVNHSVSDYIDLVPALHAIQVTGVTMDTVDGETVTYGTDDYMLQLETNPLIQGSESQILQSIYNRVTSYTIHKLDLTMYNYPTAEVFDRIAIMDTDGNRYYTYITDISFDLDGATSISCGVDTPKTTGRSVDPSARVLARARALIAQERTQREQAVIDLQDALDASAGLYATTETTESGGTIYYLHDKSTLADSQYVIKLTAQALGLSTDGGETYPYGLTIDGQAIINILTATGVNADWIDTGALTVKDDRGVVIFQADVAGGAVYIDGMSVDDGVVTISASGSTRQLQISDDGVSITDGYMTTAKFSDHGSLFSGATEIDRLTGSLRIGNYAFRPHQDYSFELTWTPIF